VAADLDDWIDEPIEVEFLTREEAACAGEPAHSDYTLEGADERGILLGYLDESEPIDYKIVFFPWPRIERIHLLTPTVSQEAIQKSLAVDRIRERHEHYAQVDATDPSEATRTYVEDVGLLLSVLRSREF
jgi:hypothetical protein